MTGKPKRDQRAYEACNRHPAGVPAARMTAAAGRPGGPHASRPCAGGAGGYPPGAVAVVVAPCGHRSAGCRRTAATLRNNGDLPKGPGPARVPCRGTIGSAYRRIPKQYLRDLNHTITEDIRPGGAAGDPAGLSGSRKAVWPGVRTGGRKVRKCRMGPRTLTGAATGAVPGTGVTRGTAGDCPAMTGLLKKITGWKGDGCLGPACLYRDFCNLLKGPGMTHFARPKSNTKSNAKGSRAREGTVTTYREDRERSGGRHRPRSMAGAACAAPRAMYGGSLRTRTPATQTAEAMMHVINYNIGMVTRAQTSAGSLTERDIRAVAACQNGAQAAACGGCRAPHAGTAAARPVWRAAWGRTAPSIHTQMDQGGGSVRDPVKQWRIRPGFLLVCAGWTHPRTSTSPPDRRMVFGMGRG